jgi:hypothetical protein
MEFPGDFDLKSTMKILLLRGLLLLDAAISSIGRPADLCAGAGGTRVPLSRFAARGGLFDRDVGLFDGDDGIWTGRLATGSLPHLINIGILRGALECGLGVFYLARGTITIPQAGLGTLVAGLLAVAYVVFYPRLPRAVASAQPAPAPS